MSAIEKIILKVETWVDCAPALTWEYWINPQHIMKWNNASEDWHTSHAESDFREGGKFLSRMAAKDGSQEFDFTGIFDVITIPEYIEYTLADGRKVNISFTAEGKGTRVIENFEAEEIHAHELQVQGWQAILENFKKYAESNRPS
ncbi:MAG: SRPBCC domain-containing protein [Ferruginibacter sp.]